MSTKNETKEEEDIGPGEDSEESSHKSAVIKNIQNLKHEFLDMLVENVLRESPESKDVSIEVIPECDCAVVTFTNNKGEPLPTT